MNELVQVIQQTGLEKSKIEVLLEKYSNSFKQASVAAEKAKVIIVTDVEQTEVMYQARTARLELRDIRIKVEKTRVALKEQSVREGKAIDGAANIIKALIVPVEQHLEQQEKFAEYKEAERIVKRTEDRINLLTPYINDTSLYNLKDMKDDVFDNLLRINKEAFEAKKAAEEKVEADRLAQEREIAKERVRIEAENKRLKKEAEEREAKAAKERQEREAKAAKEHQEQEEKVAKERLEQEKKMTAERKAKEVAEFKLKAERDAIEQKQREAQHIEETRKKVEEEAQKKALLAPDKEKIMKFADVLNLIVAPHVASREAGIVIDEALKRIASTTNYLEEKAKEF